MYNVEKAYHIEFGMMGYGAYIDNLDRTASPAKYKAAACKLMNAIKNNNNEFCIVISPDYKTCIATKTEGSWQIVANICSCEEQTRSVNQIVWKKYRVINGADKSDIFYVGDPKKKDKWTWKSFKNVKAECIGIADEQAIKLIGEDNPLIEGMFPESTEE